MRFLDRKDKFLKYKNNKNNFIFIIFIILYYFLNNILIYNLKKIQILNNISLLKFEFFLKSKFYMYLLNFDFKKNSNLLKKLLSIIIQNNLLKKLLSIIC
jgi:hypothetical protein